jgi:glycosyltransferase involved in cell wall biosynthesis
MCSLVQSPRSNSCLIIPKPLHSSFEAVKIVMQPKILSVTSLFNPFCGGAERQALLLARQLKTHGISVSVLTRQFSGLQNQEAVQGVPVWRSIRSIPLGKLFGLCYFFSCLWFLIRKRRSYDIIQCYILNPFHCLPGILMKYLFGKKVIIRISATGPLSDFLTLQRGLLGNFFLEVTRKADILIVLCRQSQHEAQDAGFGPQQIILIPNAVDTSLFAPSDRLPSSFRNILFVGRLDEMKGVDILLNAIAELKKRGIESSCTIVGDGPIKQDLQSLSGKLHIENQVSFAGTCSDIVRHLHNAAIFVLPSRSEGMPNVILEAMACGIPVIATSVGGIPDIIQNGRNGLLVAPDDIQALSSAIATLFSDPDLADRIGNRARMDAESLFSLDRITGAYLALYKNLAGHEQ